jgi:hypothetical protein
MRIVGAVGDLIDLAAARASRTSWLAAMAVHARMHPALRWQAGADTSTAHRRTPLGRAVCGAAGLLLLADPDTPLCCRCYPGAPQRRDLGA